MTIFQDIAESIWKETISPTETRVWPTEGNKNYVVLKDKAL